MRYIILVSAVLMQICLGATYSWSVLGIGVLAGIGAGLVFDRYLSFTPALFVQAGLLVICSVGIHRQDGVVNQKDCLNYSDL